MKKLSLVLLVCFIVLSKSEASITYNNKRHTIFWNGLLWCILDYWSIVKYHSTDTPMKLFYYKQNVL